MYLDMQSKNTFFANMNISDGYILGYIDDKYLLMMSYSSSPSLLSVINTCHLQPPKIS